MLQTDRFLLLKNQKHLFLQPDCPVYVHCTQQSEDRRSGAKLVQLRMVNCGQGTVETVVFDLEGLTPWGEVCFCLPALVMTGCKAKSGMAFGDDRVFSLRGNKADHLRVTVRQVIFTDGMCWKFMPSHRITTVQEAGWLPCSCGMPNPQERASCIFCGAALQNPRKELQKTDELPVIDYNTDAYMPPSEPEPKPAPILRSRLPVPEPPVFEIADEEEDEESEGVPVWLSVLLCVFGTLALLALLAFGAFFLHQYIL